LGDGRRQVTTAGTYLANGADQLFRAATFGQITQCTGVQQPLRESRIIDQRHDHHARCTLRATYAFGQLDPAHARHVHVHQRNVGLEFADQAQTFFGAASFADNADISLLQNHAKAGAYQLVVVHQDYVDHPTSPRDCVNLGRGSSHCKPIRKLPAHRSSPPHDSSTSPRCQIHVSPSVGQA